MVMSKSKKVPARIWAGRVCLVVLAINLLVVVCVLAWRLGGA